MHYSSSYWLKLLADEVSTCKTTLSFDKINASIHHGWIIKRLTIEEDLKMLFLPAYYPELAPIETLFSLIKTKVRRNVDEEQWDFSKDTGTLKIASVLSLISRETIQGIWIKVVGFSKAIILKNNSA